MNAPGGWGMSPRESVRAACAEHGETWVVGRCVHLLEGGALDTEVGEILAGPAARQVMAGAEGGPSGYWVRVWALRGLLYAWSDSAAPYVVAHLHDDAWRVREMALKVTARREVDAALEEAASLQDDGVARVRRAAQRALATLASAAERAHGRRTPATGRPRGGGAKGARLTP